LATFKANTVWIFFFQVKNLPIKSPKVPTLKKALKRFHQSQRGKNSKPLMTKLLAEASLKEDAENKEGKVGHFITVFQFHFADSRS